MRIEDSKLGEVGERTSTRRAGLRLGDGLGDFEARKSEFWDVRREAVGVPNERLLRGVLSSVDRDSRTILLWLSRAECRRGGDSS